MTPQELAAELGQLGDALSNPQELLSELGDDIVTRMKANYQQTLVRSVTLLDGVSTGILK